jgi:hypothetical protein
MQIADTYKIWQGWDLAVWLERLTANSLITTVLRSIPASLNAVESEGRQMTQYWILYVKIKKIQTNPPLKIWQGMGMLLHTLLMSLFSVSHWPNFLKIFCAFLSFLKEFSFAQSQLFAQEHCFADFSKTCPEPVFHFLS